MDTATHPEGLPPRELEDPGHLVSIDAALAAIVEGRASAVAGLRGSAAPYLVAKLAETGVQVVVLSLDDDGKQFADDASFYGQSRIASILHLPSYDNSPYVDVSPDRRAEMARMACLAHLASERPWSVLSTSASAWQRLVVPRAVVEASLVTLEVNEAIDRDALVAQLSSMGYLRVPIVEDPGSFAIRGSLVDVWTPSLDVPIRVELLGDDILSMRPFDPFEQKTKRDAHISSVDLTPVREAIVNEAYVRCARASLTELADAMNVPTMKARALIEEVTTARALFGADGYLPAFYDALDPVAAYVPKDAIVVVVGDGSLSEVWTADGDRYERDRVGRESAPHFAVDAFLLGAPAALTHLESRRCVNLRNVSDAATLHIRSFDQYELARAMKEARGTKGHASDLGPLKRRVDDWRASGFTTALIVRTLTQATRLEALLRHQAITANVVGSGGADMPEVADADIRIIVGSLSRGMLLAQEKLSFIVEDEVLGGRAPQKRRESRKTDQTKAFLEDLRSLAVGDLVVHIDHGIGRYQGLVHKDLGHTQIDLIAVEYAGGDRLYLPIYRLNQIQKFSGGEGAKPPLDRLGGSTFSKTKAKARRQVQELADELLRLYAERNAAVSEALPPRNDDYFAFEATFPFEETKDQARAIADVGIDLERSRPMDRLVCGDVGFGKTEIALRAAFRVALAGRQVALLCPTTVLAQQHLRTFDQRMTNFGVNVRGLSRFTSAKDASATLKGLKDGSVDVVVGTHRLLSKDVHFKRLGLLVVDEEQRFGVTHKERMKQMRTHVDVLTLSATPIPRTLQMAVTKLRDLSLMTTPPADRRSVRTIVSLYDVQIIREAITRELSRGGQVFYVFGRIEGLYERAQKLREIMPRARIAVAHGQMGKLKHRDEVGAVQESGALEDVMLDFLEGRYDVLVSTAIVESGLDIPRANTMIIDRADKFGLAQLYQLRGRVGRSKERAYCYLLVPPANQMTDESRARIEALERHTELGSGFQIASLDLELRGEGDLLGAEQSGSMESVGLELFCQMLDEATAELRGETIVHEVDPELAFDVSALLPEEYVGDVGLRLSLYKRLASAIDEAHVDEIAAEMEDRFGSPPREALALVQLMRLKTELRSVRALGCEASAKLVTLHLRQDTPLDGRKLLELAAHPKSRYHLTPDGKLTRRFDGGDGLTNAETMLSELSRLMR